LGSYTRGAPGSEGYPAMTPRVTAMTVRDGRVCAIWDIANPDKFTGSPLRGSHDRKGTEAHGR
jgi:RNA polymerase sigma-70 factor, ECF subfamily